MDKIKDIKLVVCDIDGTLLHDDQCMDEGIIEVVKKLKEKGIEFTFASGRNVHIMKDYVHRFALSIPYITNNGANIFLKDSLVFEKAIRKDDLHIILQALKEFDLPYLAYTNTQLFAPREDPAFAKFRNRMKGKVDIYMDAPCEYMEQQEIYKIVVILDHERHVKAFQDRISKECIHAKCTRSENDIYAISNSDVSKGLALQILLKKLELNSSQVIVIGDNYNDLSMFTVAKYAVAMGNSDPIIKQKATHIAKQNNENGVSEFLKNYIL